MSKITTHAITANREVPGMRGELSREELDAVSGGGRVSVTLFGFTIWSRGDLSTGIVRAVYEMTH